MNATSLVVVRRLPSGRWRWHFIDEGAGLSLASNHTFDDPASAERSARAAYPDLVVERVGAGAEPNREEPSPAASKARPSWMKLLGLGLVVLLLSLLLVAEKTAD